MRLKSDNDYSKLSREDTVKKLCRINKFDVSDIHKNTDILKNKLKKFERTRNLMFWHDGCTISNHSHILVMVFAFMIQQFSSLMKSIQNPMVFWQIYKPSWKSLSCTYLLVLLPLTNNYFIQMKDWQTF